MSEEKLPIETVHVKMEQLAPIIEAVVNEGGVYALPHPKGRSMYPIIISQTDTILLSKPDDLAVFDAVLFRRDSGAYVLHRIIGVHDGIYTICGDNQLTTETIRRDQIIAKLTGIRREKDGKTVTTPSDDPALCRKIRRIHRLKPLLRILAKIRRTFIRLIRSLPFCHDPGRKRSGH